MWIRSNYIEVYEVEMNGYGGEKRISPGAYHSEYKIAGIIIRVDSFIGQSGKNGNITSIFSLWLLVVD